MSRVATNQVESLNPLVDTLNFEAAALTFNGGPMPGGGGSAYPDTVQIVTDDTILTSVMQGVSLMNAANKTFTLPTTPADGETYILGRVGSGTVSVAFTGIIVGQSSPMKIDRITSFKAFNLPIIGLVWGKSDVSDLGGGGLALDWDATITYDRGQTSVRNSQFWLSLQSNNLGNDPATDDGTNWINLDKPSFLGFLTPPLSSTSDVTAGQLGKWGIIDDAGTWYVVYPLQLGSPGLWGRVLLDTGAWSIP